MRVVFMGTPAFAVPTLMALAASRKVVAVYTARDRPAGRGLRMEASPVKVAAETAGLPLEQPSSLKDSVALERLRALRPDVVCVAAYGLILPPAVLEVPTHGCVNVHASLLPRWRGAAPIERSILAGDPVTGVSIMLMEEGLDTGPYAAQVAVPVDLATADELREALSETGARLLLDVLADVERGSVEWARQDEAAATYAAKIAAADVALSPSLSVQEASRRVRASGRTAPSHASVNGRAVTVERVSPSSESLTSGQVASGRAGLRLGFADGALTVERIKPAGKSSMEGSEFVRGARLSHDACWGAPE